MALSAPLNKMKIISQFGVLQSEVRSWLSGIRFLPVVLLASLATATAGAGTNVTSLASFGTTPGVGENPFAELTLAPDGLFYGTTESDGLNGWGTVFRFANTNGGGANSMALDYCASFDGVNGLDPESPLVPGPDGNLYGTTTAGGVYGYGNIFMLVLTNGTATPALVNLASFDGTNSGSWPMGPLVFYTNSSVKPSRYSLYGAAQFGGTNGGYGTVFRWDATGGLTSLSAFDGGPALGAQPMGGVVLGADGNLYGTTCYGGSNNLGTIFLYQLASQYSGLKPLDTLYDFAGTDGAQPQAGLVLGPDKQSLFGTTTFGGTNGGGTLFSMTGLNKANSSSGVTMTPLWEFGGTNGMGSTARLLLGKNGSFYGTTQLGGKYGEGTIFSYNTNGTFTRLYSFAGTSYGYEPQSGLAQGLDGNFYGVTSYGGTSENLDGVVYELSGFPPFIISQPSNPSMAGQVLTVHTNSTNTFTASAGGTLPLTFYWRLRGRNLDSGVTVTNATHAATSTLTIVASKTSSTNTYDVVIKNSYGSVTSSVVTLAVAATFGTNPPIVNITSPTLDSSYRTMATSLNVGVRGTAVGDLHTTVKKVLYRLNGSPPQMAPPNGSSWSVGLTLRAGSNLFQVYALDSRGQYSATNYAWITPQPFVPVAGTYNGLFLNTNGLVNPTNAGFFSLNVDRTSGGYSGSLQMGGVGYTMSGSFTNYQTNAFASTTAKNGNATLSVVMWLDLTTNSIDRIFGRLSNSNGSWQANLAGDLVISDTINNPCQWAPSTTTLYNFALSGTNLTLGLTNLTLPGTNFSLSANTSPTQPAAGTYGAVTVKPSGQITFTATPSDGSPAWSQSSVYVSKNGLWPLYVSPYGGKGLVWGWQSFPPTNNPNGCFRGDLAWIRPPASTASKYYTNGFNLRTTPMGSYYAPLGSGTNVFGSSTTSRVNLIAVGGNLPMAITNTITVSPNNQVANAQLNSSITNLSLTFSLTPGTFSGSFALLPAAGGKTVAFSGVVLENTNSTGFFLGTNQSGQVWITHP